MNFRQHSAANISTRGIHLSLVAAALACAGPWDAAVAQSEDQQWDYCLNEDASYAPDLVLPACTALIQSGRLEGGDLALAYFSRAIASSVGGRDDAGAIADYSQAIRLSPQWSEPYYSRAYSYERLGDHARAAADRAEKTRLDAANLARRR